VVTQLYDFFFISSVVIRFISAKKNARTIVI
jgi:hypothetical protein